MSTITVSNETELMNALATAAAGDTILLESGDYGSVTFANIHFTDYVTIKSADGNMGAVFSSIVFDNSSHLRVDNVHVANETNGDAASKLVSVVGGSEYIQFANSEVHGLVDGEYQGHFGLHAGDATHVLFENNYIHDVKRGVVAIGPDDIQVIGNTIDYIGDDSMKFGNNDGVLIENNVGAGHIFPAPGAHLDFIQFQASSTNITVRGNILLPDSKVYVQGIFMDDGVYNNVVVENNLIYNAATRGISIVEGSNITVTNNTVLTTPDFGHKGSLILLPSGSVKEYNIQSSVSVYAGQNGTNITVQWDDPTGPYYYDSVFTHASQGFGVTVEDLVPIAGSVAESFGAFDLIARLMGEVSGDSTTGSSTDTTTDSSTDTSTDTTGGTSTDTTTGTSTDTTTDSSTDTTTTEPAPTGSGDTVDTDVISETGSDADTSGSNLFERFYDSYSLFSGSHSFSTLSLFSTSWGDLDFSGLFGSRSTDSQVTTAETSEPLTSATASADDSTSADTSDGSLLSSSLWEPGDSIFDLGSGWLFTQ